MGGTASVRRQSARQIATDDAMRRRLEEITQRERAARQQRERVRPLTQPRDFVQRYLEWLGSHNMIGEPT